MKKAKDKFRIPIQEISAMDNFSSENISDQYYEYFTYIYEFAKKEKNTEFMKKIINEYFTLRASELSFA